MAVADSTQSTGSMRRRQVFLCSANRPPRPHSFRKPSERRRPSSCTLPSFEVHWIPETVRGLSRSVNVQRAGGIHRAPKVGTFTEICFVRYLFLFFFSHSHPFFPYVTPHSSRISAEILCSEGGRVSARTEYKTLDSNRYLSLVEMRLGSGRQHQIRRHAALSRHAVVGDRRYCEPKFCDKMRQVYDFEGMALHASQLLLHVSDTEQYRVALELPEEWACFGLDESREFEIE